ncbi:MAG: hypothetical protein H0W29_07040 [Gemmatimonadales bacterium]|nr:hypothetical protein [Gemmatimonadales bacterium]
MEILLTQGKVATIDEADYALVSPYKWHAFRIHRVWYAATNIHGKRLYLHRLIMENPSGDVDHKNHDGLDNRRTNLRVASRRGLNIAAARFTKNKHGFRGVAFHTDGRRTKPWQGVVKVDQHNLSCGYFATAEEAARARDRLARMHFGEFARLNFPDG